MVTHIFSLDIIELTIALIYCNKEEIRFEIRINGKATYQYYYILL